MRKSKPVRMIVLIGGLLVLSGVVGREIAGVDRTAFSAALAQEAGGLRVTEVTKQITQKTNEFREKETLPKVETNSKLTKAAQYFAEYMAKTGEFSHTADKKQPAERAREQGYEYCLVSENIGYRFSSRRFREEQMAQGFFDGWKQSEGHRKNMVDPDVTEIGVGLARSDETGYFYAVQMFGRPLSKTIQFQFVNQTGAAVKYKIGDREFSLPPRLIMRHQSCRAPEVTFEWPGGDKKKSVKPQDGQRYVIVRDRAGEFSVRGG